MIQIEGNPHKYQDFAIYLDGKEVVSWSSQEIKDDELSSRTSKYMFDLYLNNQQKLIKLLTKINKGE
tara:strand:+ start:461 stop:661 length:201 start_codon:yes stop_codon:yes gene_type:complete